MSVRINTHSVDINTKVWCTLQTYKEHLNKDLNSEKRDNSLIFKLYRNFYG